MDQLIAIGLPYVTIIIFVVGMGYRFRSWIKTPQPGKMTLFPAPPADKSLLWPVIKESLFFPKLFKADRSLWIASWIFHAMLALIILGHLRVFTGLFDRMLAGMGVNVENMSATAGGAAGIVILVCGLMLLFRRMLYKRVREITNFSDFFALLLVLAIIVTGDWMRFGEHFDLEITRTYFAQLFTFSFVGMTLPASGLFWTHFILVQLLIIYIPFSKILHFGGIFFTQTLIQKS
ncbi:respiratory nitrate reductase subunit gamma [bacterium]|nr:respiratory nitrate reductase subunit gamma [bacterium]MBU1650878.1 respiratory nitrate reductase subunit gamma [bacterium]